MTADIKRINSDAGNGACCCETTEKSASTAHKILSIAQSICPLCHKPIEAFYVEEKGRVYFVKECDEHGIFRTLASENAENFKEWIKHPVVNIPPKRAITKGAAGISKSASCCAGKPGSNDLSGSELSGSECPLHCGTCENHLQTACCVLIDITDRCNQHCPYCFAKSETDADISGEPTLEELAAKFDLLLELGEERTFNIQLSGGEPTVRDDLPQIIRLARDKGFEYIQINTNGRRLATEEGYARKLKESGASVVFMQFDGTRDDIYEALRGEPLLAIKKQAIRNCEKAGLGVTLVPTIVNGVNTDNIGEMMDFLVENVNVVKGIHFQPVSFFGRHPEAPAVSEKCDVNDADGGKNSGTAVHSGDFEGRITMFGLLEELQKQRPQFSIDDMCPIATGHTLCCFYSTYIREPDGSVKCTLSAKKKEEGVSCCDTEEVGVVQQPGGACCCGTSEIQDSCCCGQEDSRMDALEIIKKDRDYVLDKWEIAEPEEIGCCCDTGENAADSVCCCGSSGDSSPQYTSSDEIMDMDEFLRYYRRNTFTVTGMAFQDMMNLDSERLKRCRVQVLSDDNRLIPFCAYNSIYRK